MDLAHQYLTLNERFASFLDGAVDAAFWATHVHNDDDDLPQPAQEFPVTDTELTILRGTIAHHTRDWFIAHLADITRAADALGHFSHIGHDFWLTSQGHGAGFWDRGLDEIGDTLTDSVSGHSDIVGLYLNDEATHVHIDPYNVQDFSTTLFRDNN